MQKNAPLCLPDAAKPDFGTANSVVVLTRGELVPNTTMEIAQP